MSRKKKKQIKKNKARMGAPPPDASPARPKPKPKPKPKPRSARASQPGFSGLAIAGFVFAFLLSPLGLLLSALALQRIGSRQRKGRGLAIAGLVLSIIFLIVVFPTQLRALQLYIQKA